MVAVRRASASTYGPPENNVERVSATTSPPASNRSPFSVTRTPNGDGVKSLTSTRIGKRTTVERSSSATWTRSGTPFAPTGAGNAGGASNLLVSWNWYQPTGAE